jgi:voltage-gated potassium channel
MKLELWDRLTEWPLVVASLAFLGFYSWQVIGNLQAPENAVPEAAMAILWLVFAVDYLIRLYLANPRKRWFVRNIPLLLIVALPFLRPLRLLRLVTVLSALSRGTGRAFRGRITLYIASAVPLLVIIGGLAILDAEQNAEGANITSFRDGLWWAFATITTVGYGDRFPVTDVGRLVAVGLMLAGIGVLGTVTATVAQWFVELVGKEKESEGSLSSTD